jgi:hypothetical protein
LPHLFWVVSRHDHYEGIEAMLIDKDNHPRWVPETFAEVTADAVETISCRLNPSLCCHDRHPQRS